MFRFCKAIMCVLCATQLAFGQHGMDNVEIKVTKVAGQVYMFEGRGGNIGVSVGPDGILLVDDQFAPLADKIKKALKDLSKGDLKFVLNTHWHRDHTDGNKVFGKEATIVAHDNVRERLSTTQHIRGRTIEAAPQHAWPVITFDESLSIHFNDEEIRVVHYPHGHTDGDSVIYFEKSNVVHMGDQFFAGKFPFVDISSGGDVQGLINNIAAVLKETPKDAKIIPGHGPLSTVEDLKTYHAMLVETTGIIQKSIDAGKSLDEIKAKGLPKKWDDWGTGFIKTNVWIETVYSSLTS